MWILFTDESTTALSTQETTPRDEPVCDIYIDQDLLGYDIKVYGEDNVLHSEMECCEECLNNVLCLAWTFHKQTGYCWLKDSIPNLVFNNGYISGIKTEDESTTVLSTQETTPRDEPGKGSDAQRKIPSMFLEIPSGVVYHYDCEPGLRTQGTDVIMCNEGQLEPSYPECLDIDECADFPEVCTGDRICHNTIGSYECQCMDGYTSMNGLCVPRRDDDHVIEGVMRRFCDSTGQWNEPHTLECKSKEMTELTLQVSTANSTSEKIAVLNTLRDFFLSIKQVYTGDVLAGKEIFIDLMSKKPINIDDNGEIMSLFLQALLDTASNLLNVHLKMQWKQIHEYNGVADGAMSILEKIELANENIYKYMVTTGRNVFIESNNIDIIGKFIQEEGIIPTRTRRSNHKLENTTTSLDDYVMLSDSFLEEINSDDIGTSGTPSALIMVLYKDLGEVLPTSPKTNKKRQLIKSVTAVQRVDQVNTMVVSVILHPKTHITRSNFSEPVVLRLPLKMEGYNPRCSFINFGATMGLWDNTGCQFVKEGTDRRGQYIECECFHLTTFGVIMTLGIEPVPFKEAARKGFIYILSAISFLLIFITFLMVCIARYYHGRYFALRMAFLSFAVFPVLICVSVYIDGKDDDKVTCQMVAILLHYFLLSNCFWTMNLGIQQLLWLKRIEHRRTERLLYAISGWVLPIIVVGICCAVDVSKYGLTERCWVPTSMGLMLSSVGLATLLITITFVNICYCYYLLLASLHNYEESDILRFWDEMFSLTLSSLLISTTRILGVITTVNHILYMDYGFAGMMFIEASVLFLCYVGTHIETLTGIRIRFTENDCDNGMNTSMTEDVAGPSGIRVNTPVKGFCTDNDDISIINC
ncbi:adhesion G protein-coupled receptor E3-like [Glandiceps talaboti]